MPTTAQNTYSGYGGVMPVFNPDDAIASQVDYAVAASSTLAAGTVVGEVTATPGIVKAYASGNVDGSQTPIGILQYAVTTDGSGNITNANEWGLNEKVTPVWKHGDFKLTDLTGLDANATTKLGGYSDTQFLHF